MKVHLMMNHMKIPQRQKDGNTAVIVLKILSKLDRNVFLKVTNNDTKGCDMQENERTDYQQDKSTDTQQTKNDRNLYIKKCVYII